jgi:hypothetical protein
LLQILTLKDSDEETQDDRQGKMLLHTEYSLLSLLHDQDGVIHHHGFFKVNCLIQNNQFPVLKYVNCDFNLGPVFFSGLLE